MEHYFQTVYSQIRHGRCGGPDPRDARERVSQTKSLIRVDLHLDDLMKSKALLFKTSKASKSKKKRRKSGHDVSIATEATKQGVKEYVWLADFLFEMIYLYLLYWNDEEKKLLRESNIKSTSQLLLDETESQIFG